MAGELPPGFEIEDGMAPGPSRRLPAPNTGTPEPPLSFLMSPQTAATPGGSATPSLPPGFEIEKPGADHAGTKTGLVQAALTGIGDQPIIGPLLSKAHSAVQAAANPLDRALGLAPEGSSADSFAQRFAANEEEKGKAREAAYAERPIVANTANLAAGVALPLGIVKGAPSLGAKLLGMTGRTLPGQIARMGASGAAIGATDAALRGQDPQTAAVAGGLIGGATAPVARAVGSVAGRLADRVASRAPGYQAQVEQTAENAIGAPARGIEPVVQDGRLSTEGLHQAASNGYNALDTAGARLQGTSADRLVLDVNDHLVNNNFRPEYQPGTWKILNNLFDASRSPNGLKFGDVFAARKALNGMTRGIPTEETEAARTARDQLDRFMNNISQKDVLAGNPQGQVLALNQANKNWGAYKTADLIEQALQTAELNAASGGSGRSNYANSLRQAIKPIVKKINSGALKVSPEVEAALNRVVRGSAYGTRLLSKFAPTGVVSGGIDIGLAHLLGGGLPGAAAVGAVGHGTKVLQDRIVLGRVMRAIQLAQNQAPAQQQFARTLVPPVRGPILGSIANNAGTALRAPVLAQDAYQQQ